MPLPTGRGRRWGGGDGGLRPGSGQEGEGRGAGKPAAAAGGGGGGEGPWHRIGVGERPGHLLVFQYLSFETILMPKIREPTLSLLLICHPCGRSGFSGWGRGVSSSHSSAQNLWLAGSDLELCSGLQGARDLARARTRSQPTLGSAPPAVRAGDRPLPLGRSLLVRRLLALASSDHPVQHTPLPLLLFLFPRPATPGS